MLNLKNNFFLNHKNSFKDFISINQFVNIFLKIILINLKGVFNVSLGKKVYVSEILQWLTSSSKKSLNVKNYYKNMTYNSDSFTLNNAKLKNVLNISIKKTYFNIIYFKNFYYFIINITIYKVFFIYIFFIYN